MTTLTETQKSRLDRLSELLTKHQQTVEDYDQGAEEDLRPYYRGDKEIARFCCVTVNYSSQSYAKTFFLPKFDNLDAAIYRATEYAQDDIFEELPVEVVDLDNGLIWEPVWTTLEWRRITPEAPDGAA